MSKNVPIYLVGMMGAGKSTVGALLAARLGRAFLDTDCEVERATGQKISEIFETSGEAHFRRLEADAIRSAEVDAAVVALGGGAAIQPGAMDRLLERGEVVFLMVDPETLMTRIGDRDSRPLLAGLEGAAQLEKLASLLAERMPFYQRARVRIDARGTPEQVVDRILDGLDC